MSITITFPIGYKPVLKHGEHDQSDHGSWASGITAELSEWSPKDSVPASPRNAGGMTEKIWDNWEHGVDGYQFVELYRQYAGEALGIAVPKSDMDVGGQSNYLTQRGFGGSSTDTVRNQTEAMLKAIANGKPEQPTLYRGMTATNAESQALLDSITKLKAGDTLDMPLVSTTRSLGVATWYAADRSANGTENVVMKIQSGAKGVSLSKETSYYPQDHEVITSGKFEVVGISKIETPYWQREVLRPSKTEYTDGSKPSYETVGVKQNLGDPKKVYETVASGNWKSLETSTFKLTNDRRSYSADRPVLSAWSQQPPREFTVVEVKFIEPHVIQKAESNDYGMTFDALFNNVPFIREEDVTKHGDHDQSSHGAWATGTVSDFKSETIPASELGARIVSGEKISAKITVQNESFTILQINEKYGDGTVVMNMGVKDSKNKNIGYLGASNQIVQDKKYAEITNVQVASEYQRRGVATAMLNFARKNMMEKIEIRHDRFRLSDDGRAWSNVTKHGEHDQSTHGSWATGSGGAGIDITDKAKSYFGTNIDEHKTSESRKELAKRQREGDAIGRGGENFTLEIVAEKQGFDGKPKVVSSEEIDQLEKDGWAIAYRGINYHKETVLQGYDEETGLRTQNLQEEFYYSAESLAEEFRTGNYHAGAGTDGDGIYFASNETLARDFAGPKGVVVRVAIPPNSVLTPDVFHDEIKSHREKINKGGVGDFFGADDIGVSLASKGIRGAQSLRYFNRSETAEPVFVIWDRSMLAVEKAKP